MKRYAECSTVEWYDAPESDAFRVNKLLRIGLRKGLPGLGPAWHLGIQVHKRGLIRTSHGMSSKTCTKPGMGSGIKACVWEDRKRTALQGHLTLHCF